MFRTKYVATLEPRKLHLFGGFVGCKTDIPHQVKQKKKKKKNINEKKKDEERKRNTLERNGSERGQWKLFMDIKQRTSDLRKVRRKISFPFSVLIYFYSNVSLFPSFFQPVQNSSRNFFPRITTENSLLV